MYQNDALKCLVKNARLSYCNLTEPRASVNGGEPKYSVTLLIPKSDAATKADIDNAIRMAIEEGKKSKWNGVCPPNPKVPIHDGDGVRESGEPFGEECKGCWVMTASSKQKPDVVDSTLNPIINQSDIYSGMFAHITVRFFAYASNGNKGIGCGLGNVMKTADGDPLSGHTNAATDFEGLGSPTQPVAQQYPAYTPQAPAPQPGYPAWTPKQATPVQQAPQINPITGLPF